MQVGERLILEMTNPLDESPWSFILSEREKYINSHRGKIWWNIQQLRADFFLGKYGSQIRSQRPDVPYVNDESHVRARA